MTATTDLRWEIDEPGAWEIDAVHFPTPITPYHAEILCRQFPRGFAEGSRRLGMLLSHFDHRVVNGFDYIAPRPVGAPKHAKGPPPRPIWKLLTLFHPEIRRRLATAARVFDDRPWREDVALWEREIRPASTRRHLELDAVDPAALDRAALAEHLVALHENAHHQYYLHHRFTVSALVPVGDFLATVSEWTGLGKGELMQACRQPRGVVTVAQAHFDAVVTALRTDAAAARLLGGGQGAAEILAALAALPGATGHAVKEWLRMTAHRLVTGYDIVDLTALEMPELLVRTLRTTVADAAPTAQREQARLAAAARVRDAVPAAHRERYDTLLAEALSVSNLREERALVCDFWAYGLVRRALKVAGAQLAGEGRIADPAHLFDASHAEMLSLLVPARASVPPPTADTLAARHHYRTTTTADIAPRRIGLPPQAPPPADWLPANVRRTTIATAAAVEALFAEPEPRTEPKAVRGLNASAGQYEGRARVVLHPAQFGRIERGDVLVARMTTEAYNGIMPLLGAVVTDRGGLLSHTATVAREFGIPAVVGTTHATKIIPDGARLLVDGTRGEARLI